MAKTIFRGQMVQGNLSDEKYAEFINLTGELIIRLAYKVKVDGVTKFKFIEYEQDYKNIIFNKETGQVLIIIDDMLEDIQSLSIKYIVGEIDPDTRIGIHQRDKYGFNLTYFLISGQDNPVFNIPVSIYEGDPISVSSGILTQIQILNDQDTYQNGEIFVSINNNGVITNIPTQFNINDNQFIPISMPFNPNTTTLSISLIDIDTISNRNPFITPDSDNDIMGTLTFDPFSFNFFEFSRLINLSLENKNFKVFFDFTK